MRAVVRTKRRRRAQLRKSELPFHARQKVAIASWASTSGCEGDELSESTSDDGHEIGPTNRPPLSSGICRER